MRGSRAVKRRVSGSTKRTVKRIERTTAIGVGLSAGGGKIHGDNLYGIFGRHSGLTIFLHPTG